MHNSKQEELILIEGKIYLMGNSDTKHCFYKKEKLDNEYIYFFAHEHPAGHISAVLPWAMIEQIGIKEYKELFYKKSTLFCRFDGNQKPGESFLDEALNLNTMSFIETKKDAINRIKSSEKRYNRLLEITIEAREVNIDE